MNHGQRSTYVKGCRCDACRGANARYAKLAKYRQDTGRRVLVDAAPVKAHLEQLRAAGVGKRAIAARAEVSQTVINRLLGIDHSRPAVRVRPEVARKLLAVQLDDHAQGANVDSIGTTRRIQALVAIGWSQSALAARIGWTPSNFAGLAHGRTDYVTARTARLVAQLYEQLSMQPGPSNRARSLARTRSWAPPLAWDDDTIDDRSARPHGADNAARWMTSRRDTAALVEDFNDIRNAGGTFASAAARLGMSEQALERALYRARKQGFEVADFNKENAA